MTRPTVAFVGSARPAARALLSELVARYGQVPRERAEVVVAVGGDGTALAALMAGIGAGGEAGIVRGGPPVYLVRTAGSVGFLGQAVTVEDLPARLDAARAVPLHPLRAEASRRGGPDAALLGLNDVVLVRSRLQSARLRLTLDGERDGGAVAGDGLVVATPLGSTAYTRSLGGPSLPLGSGTLALTAIAPAPGHAWPSLVVPDRTVIRLDVVDAEHRPVRLETSGGAVEHVERVRISCERTTILTLLVDPDRPTWPRTADAVMRRHAPGTERDG